MIKPGIHERPRDRQVAAKITSYDRVSLRSAHGPAGLSTLGDSDTRKLIPTDFSLTSQSYFTTKTFGDGYGGPKRFYIDFFHDNKPVDLSQSQVRITHRASSARLRAHADIGRDGLLAQTIELQHSPRSINMVRNRKLCETGKAETREASLPQLLVRARSAHTRIVTSEANPESMPFRIAINKEQEVMMSSPQREERQVRPQTGGRSQSIHFSASQLMKQSASSLFGEEKPVTAPKVSPKPSPRKPPSGISPRIPTAPPKTMSGMRARVSPKVVFGTSCVVPS